MQCHRAASLSAGLFETTPPRRLRFFASAWNGRLVNISYPSNVPTNLDTPDEIQKKILLSLLGVGPTGSRNLGVLVAPSSFKATASFTRPADTTAYAQYDAITNSTSAPTVMTLAIAGAASGDFIDIRNVRLNTSTKPSGTKLSANVFFAPATFTATNDNAELSIDDTTAAGGVWCPCANQYQTALNYRAASDPVSMLMQLSAASIYATLQANTAWAPGNADTITLVVEGFLYKA